ncbi:MULTISPECIES: hypothetical protein [unclassified Endozoicomonas]|uniref:hypothetical protein n=1 Tax=unclassified Endozoicomonas TaxID=2644528 RepID=UPI002147CFA1|nr:MULTISPECIES: hypothetical protein [unclassified Endozoicomonas]
MTNVKHPSFKAFLDSLLTSDDIVSKLRSQPADSFYRESKWHTIADLLQHCPDLLEALNGYAFKGWDSSIAFTANNLKACYLIDEDFINGGRAFVLFNLVATSWFHLSEVSHQAVYWEISEDQ